MFRVVTRHDLALNFLRCQSLAICIAYGRQTNKVLGYIEGSASNLAYFNGTRRFLSRMMTSELL